MQVRYRRDPVKVLRRMQRAKAEDITEAIERIAADPWAPNSNVRPLKGVPGGFRARVGDWRVSYKVDTEAQAVEVFEVAPRGRGVSMSGTKIRFLGELEGSLTALAIAESLEAQAVGEAEEADLVVVRPTDLDELIEDAAAAAAFRNTRDQETVPAEVVDRLIAGENPVKVWREHRGLSQRALANRAGLNFAYLSQIETGARKGPIATIKKLADALDLDLGDLT